MPVEKTDNEMLFVYQSKDIRRLYQQYGKHLVLLYATKYSFKLHFLVVQTNVNCQVAAVLVTQEETKRMSLKTLQIIKGNFNTLEVIFSFPFLISLFSTNTLFLYFDFCMILEDISQEE